MQVATDDSFCPGCVHGNAQSIRNVYFTAKLNLTAGDIYGFLVAILYSWRPTFNENSPFSSASKLDSRPTHRHRLHCHQCHRLWRKMVGRAVVVSTFHGFESVSRISLTRSILYIAVWCRLRVICGFRT